MLRFVLILSGFIITTPCFAQSGDSATHADVLAQLTFSCLDQAVDDVEAFRFLPQGATELSASPVVSAWTDAGKTVFREPSEAEAPLLVATTDQASIDLERSGRRMVRRTASIDLTWWLSSVEGDVIGTDTCRSSVSDELSRDAARSMAVSGSSVLDPKLPPKSRLLHAAEPVVLLGATAVGTYLLFNLRSRRSDDG